MRLQRRRSNLTCRSGALSGKTRPLGQGLSVVVLVAPGSGGEPGMDDAWTMPSFLRIQRYTYIHTYLCSGTLPRHKTTNYVCHRCLRVPLYVSYRLALPCPSLQPIGYPLATCRPCAMVQGRLVPEQARCCGPSSRCEWMPLSFWHGAGHLPARPVLHERGYPGHKPATQRMGTSLKKKKPQGGRTPNVSPILREKAPSSSRCGYPPVSHNR